MMNIKNILTLLLCCATSGMLSAQMITGVWKGKIDKKKVEVKIIQNGDSLAGTSYYYEGASNYLRYSIKGYFNPLDNSVVWWDDQLIEEKGKLLFEKEKVHNLPWLISTVPVAEKCFWMARHILKTNRQMKAMWI